MTWLNWLLTLLYFINLSLCSYFLTLICLNDVLTHFVSLQLSQTFIFDNLKRYWLLKLISDKGILDFSFHRCFWITTFIIKWLQMEWRVGIQCLWFYFRLLWWFYFAGHRLYLVLRLNFDFMERLLVAIMNFLVFQLLLLRPVLIWI